MNNRNIEWYFICRLITFYLKDFHYLFMLRLTAIHNNITYIWNGSHILIQIIEEAKAISAVVAGKDQS